MVHASGYLGGSALSGLAGPLMLLPMQLLTRRVAVSADELVSPFAHRSHEYTHLARPQPLHFRSAALGLPQCEQRYR